VDRLPEMDAGEVRDYDRLLKGTKAERPCSPAGGFREGRARPICSTSY
jgi:hypothetical protein